MAGAERQEGSWWPHWAGWLGEHCGAWVKPPRGLGSGAYPPLEAAPGSYVLAS